MVNYQLGKIYKIVDNTNGNIYIGSTCEPTLARRLSGHVTAYKRYLNGKYGAVTSFKIIENQNYDIVLLELCPCDTKDNLHARERHYIESLNCVNKIVVGRTDIEYQDVNKTIKKESDKLLYENNRDKIKARSKAYRESHNDEIKQWREANKEAIKAHTKAYRESNKEKINAQKKAYREAKKASKLASSV